ncbi:hypothetical protein JI747_003460 [Chryseobacterium sp. RG1]|uniref:Uncharacterized protein n=1 Tax=Chryseobacterium tagetis TaxID=2801334 RepID=A0ABS7ZWV7_9FLAO|nr:hypothetical protein [Chryseobacterium tagetis]MCA6066221.1 hypothetical protein [Chryseobacterium tagetis]
MKQIKVLIFLVLFPILHFGQLSTKVNEYFQQISQSKRAESSHIGVSGSESEVYKLHLELDKIATDKEIEYIAYNGNPVAKYYASNILFNRKSKSLEKLFKYYLKTKDSVSVLKGCVGGVSSLDTKIYLNVISEKQLIDKMEWEKKWKDSMIINKKNNTPEYLSVVEMFNAKTIWSKKEIDFLTQKLDQIVLNDLNSSEKMVEFICGHYLYTRKKVPYYEKIAYFEKKYHSEYIKKYLKFCRYGIIDPEE